MKNQTLLAVEQQLDAMGCDVYEVGLYKPHVPGIESKEPEMLPRTWDRATLIRSVPWLRYQNFQGRNIYIRPHGEHRLSMVDDLTAAAVQTMKNTGFAPSVVVETSPGNFQAWLTQAEVLPARLSTLAARALAEKFGGDKGAADWRHFGRLAGFTNRKEKYRGADGCFPYVRIVDVTRNKVFSNAGPFLAAIEQDWYSKLSRAPRSHSEAPLSIDDFRRNPKYAGDGNRIDLAFAIHAASHGVSEQDIVAAIATRDLSKKGPRQRQSSYIHRTVEKAFRRFGQLGPTRRGYNR